MRGGSSPCPHRFVAWLVYRCDDRGVVEVIAADLDELRLEVDVDPLDAGHGDDFGRGPSYRLA